MKTNFYYYTKKAIKSLLSGGDLDKKIFLLDDSLDINGIYIINNKQVYYEYVIPKLLSKGIKEIYL
jgi:hypothetical protein